MLATTQRRWATGEDLIRAFKARANIQSDKISILNAIWEKELGHLAPHWTLIGVKRGVLYVRPRSSSAALELQMRAVVLTRGLNKYFSRAWIKGIRIARD